MMARMQRAAAWVGSKLGVGNETTAEDHAPPEKCEPTYKWEPVYGRDGKELGETTSPEEKQFRGCCAEAEMPITNYRFMSEVRQAPEGLEGYEFLGHEPSALQTGGLS